MSIDTAPSRRLTRETSVSLNSATKEHESRRGLDNRLSGLGGIVRRGGKPTAADASVIDKTHARLSSLRVRIVSVRALSNARVRAVS